MQHACLQQIKLIKILLLPRIVEENNEVALCPAIQSIILKTSSAVCPFDYMYIIRSQNTCNKVPVICFGHALELHNSKFPCTILVI